MGTVIVAVLTELMIPARALLGPRTALMGFVRIHLGEDPPVSPPARVLDLALPHLEGVDQLVIADPHLPVESFIDDRGRWVGERFDISYVPSVRVAALMAARDARGGAARERMARWSPSCRSRAPRWTPPRAPPRSSNA